MAIAVDGRGKVCLGREERSSSRERGMSSWLVLSLYIANFRRRRRAEAFWQGGLVGCFNLKCGKGMYLAELGVVGVNLGGWGRRFPCGVGDGVGRREGCLL